LRTGPVYSEVAINMARLPGWGAGKLKLRSSKDFEPRPIVQTQIVPFVKRVGESSADKPPFRSVAAVVSTDPTYVAEVSQKVLS